MKLINIIVLKLIKLGLYKPVIVKPDYSVILCTNDTNHPIYKILGIDVRRAKQLEAKIRELFNTSDTYIDVVIHLSKECISTNELAFVFYISRSMFDDIAKSQKNDAYLNLKKLIESINGKTIKTKPEEKGSLGVDDLINGLVD